MADKCELCGSTKRMLAYSNNHYKHEEDFANDCTISTSLLVCGKCEYV